MTFDLVGAAYLGWLLGFSRVLAKRGSHNRLIIHSVGSSEERSLEVHGSGGLLT